MANPDEYSSKLGTTVATFAQSGTYSSAIDLYGGQLVGMYSDNWPTAAGSITFRSAWSHAGTGHPVQTNDGTALKVLAFGSGTFYSLGNQPEHTTPIRYLTLQIGTAGTATAAAGGTIVLIVKV